MREKVTRGVKILEKRKKLKLKSGLKKHIHLQSLLFNREQLLKKTQPLNRRIKGSKLVPISKQL